LAGAAISIRIRAVDSPLQAQEMLRALEGLRLGHPACVHAEVGSTNDEARRLAEAGAAEGTLVTAETQTAGRGRAGRRWLTPPGAGLAFSVVLRPRLAPSQAGGLTMLAGLAVCEAIESATGLAASLKWPNDVLVGGKKAGGILVENELEGDQLAYAIVGIGLNVSQAPPAEQVLFPATALASEAGRPVERLRLLRACLERIEARYAQLAQPEALHKAWAARLSWLGEPVMASTGAEEIAGVAEGVAPDGALIVRRADGTALRLLAGDVRLRHG
jgi:BirA family biotin operon repressor/biotin-[acetyl-CoA-carboxylase] ligase